VIALLASPRPKQAYFTIACAAASLPESIAVTLDDVAMLHARGATAAIANIRRAQTLAEPRVNATNAADRIALEPRDGTSSFLIHQGGRLGVQTLKAGLGTRVSADKRPDGGLDLIVQAVGSSSITLTSQSETVEVPEFNRTAVQPWPFPGIDAASGRPFEVANTVSMLTTTVMAGGAARTAQRAPELRISFTAGTPVFLVAPESPVISAAKQRFVLDECSIEQLALRGVPSPDVVLKQRSSLAATVGGGLKWEEISVDPQSAAIRLQARGEIASLLQDDRQVLPSAAAEWWSASPASKGVLGGLALFVVFAGGVFLKRALDVLSKAVLPDIQK
jgi:hypothetical protein